MEDLFEQGLKEEITDQKYIMFSPNRIFKKLGYYLGTERTENGETIYCFRNETAVSKIFSHELVYVFHKVDGRDLTKNSGFKPSGSNINETRLLLLQKENPEITWIDISKMASGFNPDLFRKKLPSSVRFLSTNLLDPIV